MITEEQYNAAIAQKKEAEKTIHQYHKEQQDAFDQRWQKFLRGEDRFTDEELVYSALARCKKCDSGLAYPKDCGPFHQWSCSAVLKGENKDLLADHDQLPFQFWEVKSEKENSVGKATTRPQKS